MIFKFKAINKKNKIVSEPFSLADTHIGGFFKGLYVDFPENIVVEFIQYTNKHDDYDNDIYEGDILNDEVEVYYSDDWAAFCVKKLGEKYFNNFLYQYIVNLPDDVYVKVTGNIYLKKEEINCIDCKYFDSTPIPNKQPGLGKCTNDEVPRNIVREFEGCSKGERK